MHDQSQGELLQQVRVKVRGISTDATPQAFKSGELPLFVDVSEPEQVRFTYAKGLVFVRGQELEMWG
jgi:hypothetical protein